MGKFTRKAKMAADVAVMDVSLHPSLGVRTRAKTLALRRLHSPYLELRSRRLEKHMHKQDSRNHSYGCRGKQYTETRKHVRTPITSSIEARSCPVEENNLDSQPRAGRGIRENTPCSLISRDVDAITATGSTMKNTCSSAASPIVQNALLMNVPSVHELDEFFGHEEQSLQRHFIDKYNFDVVNDLPLLGRYEWVRVMP